MLRLRVLRIIGIHIRRIGRLPGQIAQTRRRDGSIERGKAVKTVQRRHAHLDLLLRRSLARELDEVPDLDPLALLIEEAQLDSLLAAGDAVEWDVL